MKAGLRLEVRISGRPKVEVRISGRREVEVRISVRSLLLRLQVEPRRHDCLHDRVPVARWIGEHELLHRGEDTKRVPALKPRGEG